MTDSNLPILYSFRRCPWAMRGRIALAYAGVRCEIREVNLREKPVEMLEASPKGTVPTLVLADGTVIDESIDVMRWAIEQHDPDQWGEVLDHPILGEPFAAYQKNARIFKYQEDSEGWEAAREACAVFFKSLDDLVQQGFLTGDKCRFVDIAIFPLVRQGARIDEDWFASLNLKALTHWLETISAMPCFIAAMHKYPVWQASDAPAYFPLEA